MYVYTICSINKYMIDGVEQRLIYVGSTAEYEARFAHHKSNCFSEKFVGYNCKLYKLIREHGWNNFVFEVIEVCDDGITDKELLFREQFYIDKYDSKSSMNTKDAITGLDKIEYHRLYHAEYYKIHREKELARSKENYEKNREKRIAQTAEWKENNRDRVNETRRNSYHNRRLWRNALSDLRGINPSFFC